MKKYIAPNSITFKVLPLELLMESPNKNNGFFDDPKEISARKLYL